MIFSNPAYVPFIKVLFIVDLLLMYLVKDYAFKYITDVNEEKTNK